MMKLQVTTEYAIQILQYLHENPGLWTAHELVSATGITYPFFVKIANRLAKAGLLEAVQGRNGGYQLKKSAKEISIYDVVVCIEGGPKISRCMEGGTPCAEEEKRHCSVNQFFCNLHHIVVVQMSEQKIAN